MKAADGMKNRIVKAFGMSDCMYYKLFELVFPLIFFLLFFISSLFLLYAPIVSMNRTVFDAMKRNERRATYS